MEEDAVMSSEGSSIGEAVSGRGEAVMEDEEEDLYYIPERRPSLDLGSTPMDTSHWHFVDQALTPAQSYKSMFSENGSDEMQDEDEPSTKVKLQRADSYSSCYSFDSDDCEKRTPKVKDKDEESEPEELELIQDPGEIKHPSLTVKFTFETICETLRNLPDDEFKAFKKMLWTYYRQYFNSSQTMDRVDLVDRLLECYSLEFSIQITKTILAKMGKNKDVDHLQNMCTRNEVRYELSQTLRKKYSQICEDFSMKEETMPFDDVYADLHILSTNNNGPNIEHEITAIQKPENKRQPGIKITTAGILSGESVEETYIKLVLLTGVAGSGKSAVVRKIVLDWVEGRSHRDLAFVLPISFRELKQFEGSKISLVEIIQTLYPETKKLNEEEFKCYDCNIMFIFDGLDEYNGNIDFSTVEIHSDPREPTHLNTIVVNLLRGRLLLRSVCLFTSRPQVKSCIPWDTHCNDIEVQGFCDPDKDEFFKKRFKDPNQAARVIEYVKSFKTLYIMCHLPLFCSLVADECQSIFREQGPRAELPRSITYMYTKLLLALIRDLRRFRGPALSPDEEQEFLMKLGKQALTMLEQGKFYIIKTDWPKMNVMEAVIRTGLCIEYMITPMVLFHEKVISFIHPTMQEYLAALYAYLSFRNQDKVVFEQVKSKIRGVFKGHKIMELYKAAVERSLQHDDGKLDMFLRFLFGMARKTNQQLLQPFCKSSAKVENLSEDAASLIRKKTKENLSPDRNSNLQRCLEELGV
ncbi:NLR family CARD domain-containing protein 3 [Kryptolebias marmoratus]|uniref:NLR family CARD domain-containing protein 3-like n=1 Tax=Kryptolebias marmoratus TaxID=37003 RepID=A0A3Q3G0K1_KRYMA|nr:NLR family CARD domain-containing protein 3 [Kryptolebias marmoratus]